MLYRDAVLLLNILVNLLLLLGANRLCGYPTTWLATVMAAVIGGLYAWACLLPGFRFLGNGVWRLVSFAVVSGFAFGFSKSGARRGVVFALLSMALSGIAIGFGDGGEGSLLIGAGVVLLLCAVGFHRKGIGNRYIPVEVQFNGKKLRLIALQDTGNSLRDPLTGRPILVIAADAARELTGLSYEQLQDPVCTLPSAGIPGLRLIPYKTIGQPCGMLLALRLTKVRIGKWEGSSLVAFAPEKLSNEGAYQALTGGSL